MYVNGLHTDLLKPPNVPAITGQPTQKRDEGGRKPLTEALTGAATAITSMILSYQQPSTPPSSTKQTLQISPVKKASISGQYLEQLCTLQQLRKNDALTEEEFQEQKKLLLLNLRGLGMW